MIAQPDDDVASVAGRLDAATDAHVVLVVPRRVSALREAMAWPYLAAHARRRGLVLRVVATRAEVRRHAQRAGLEAAGSFRALRRGGRYHLSLGSRDFLLPAGSIGALLHGGGTLLAVAMLVGGACYFVPAAKVVVVPPSQPLTAYVEVRLNPLAEESDVQSSVVPAASVRRTIVTTVSTATTGTTEVGDQAATVELVFTNEGSVDFVAGAGTTVSDDSGVAFATEEPVTVPGGDSAAVTARAIRAGEGGNLDAGQLRLVATALPAGLSVTNPRAAGGGTNREVSAVTQEDVDRVREIADQVLLRAAVRELTAAVEDGTLFPETVSSSVLSAIPLANPGDATNAFLMEYTAVVSALYLRDHDAERFGEAVLIERLPEGAAMLPGTATVRVSEQDRTFTGGVLTVGLTATGQAAELFEPGALRGRLTSVSPATAAARVQEALGLEEPPRIEITPRWWPAWRMPRRGSRITIILAGPAATDGSATDGSASEQVDAEQAATP